MKIKNLIAIVLVIAGLVLFTPLIQPNPIQPKSLSSQTQETPKEIEQISRAFRHHWYEARRIKEKITARENRIRSLRCLTDNVYNEAGLEGPEGMLAVADVTLNRVHNIQYPDTVCSVVYERHYVPRIGKIVCAFSWTCKPRHRKIWKLYLQARKIARQALFHNEKIPVLSGVTNYYADYLTPPPWASRMQFVVQIGHHEFFKQEE